MAKCVFIQGRKVILCSGALRNKVDIMSRDQTFSNFETDVDYDIDIVQVANVPALIETASTIGGFVQPFNGVNRSANPTHNFTIRFITGVSVTNAIRFNGKFFDILGIINIDEQNSWLRIQCTERGTTTKEANFS